MQMILNMNTTLMTSYAAFFYQIDKLIQYELLLLQMPSHWEIKHIAFYSSVDCSSLKLIIKGEKEVQPQQKKIAQ